MWVYSTIQAINPWICSSHCPPRNQYSHSLYNYIGLTFDIVLVGRLQYHIFPAQVKKLRWHRKKRIVQRFNVTSWLSSSSYCFLELPFGRNLDFMVSIIFFFAVSQGWSTRRQRLFPFKCTTMGLLGVETGENNKGFSLPLFFSSAFFSLHSSWIHLP